MTKTVLLVYLKKQNSKYVYSTNDMLGTNIQVHKFWYSKYFSLELKSVNKCSSP